MLEIRGLRACRGKVEALHGASLRVDKGTIVTVIGPNSAGNTTLLGAMMGLLRRPCETLESRDGA